jgi:14-3-3 protein epsilon
MKPQQRDTDALFFVAKTASAIGRPFDSLRFLCDLMALDAPARADAHVLLQQLFPSVLEANSKWIATVEETIRARAGVGSIAYVRALEQYHTRLCREQVALYDRVVAAVGSRALAKLDAPPHEIRCHKMIADAFRIISAALDKDQRTEHLMTAREHYQTAVAIAEAKLGKLSPLYIRCVLNWTTFQMKALSLKDDATRLLYDTYSQTMRAINTVPETDRPEVSAVLELMRSNLASWTCPA